MQFPRSDISRRLRLMRRGLALLLVLLLVGTVDGARANPAISDGTGPLDTAADLAAATRFEALIPEHTFYGMVVPLGFDKWPHLDPTAKPIRMEGEADSGNYTGVYLAAQSWRYAQSKVELKKLGVDPLDNSTGGSDAVQFWRGPTQRGAGPLAPDRRLLPPARQHRPRVEDHVQSQDRLDQGPDRVRVAGLRRRDHPRRGRPADAHVHARGRQPAALRPPPELRPHRRTPRPISVGGRPQLVLRQLHEPRLVRRHGLRPVGRPRLPGHAGERRSAPHRWPRT